MWGNVALQSHTFILQIPFSLLLLPSWRAEVPVFLAKLKWRYPNCLPLHFLTCWIFWYILLLSLYCIAFMFCCSFPSACGFFVRHLDTLSIGWVFLITKFYSWCLYWTPSGLPQDVFWRSQFTHVPLGFLHQHLISTLVLIKHNSTFLQNPWKHTAHISLHGNRQTTFKRILSRADPSQPWFP